MIDDTAMATKQITSKLDMLEKIVKGKPNRFLRNRQQTETSIPDQSSTKDKKDENLSRSNQSTSSRKRYRIGLIFLFSTLLKIYTTIFFLRKDCYQIVEKRFFKVAKSTMGWENREYDKRIKKFNSKRNRVVRYQMILYCLICLYQPLTGKCQNFLNAISVNILDKRRTFSLAGLKQAVFVYNN